MLWEFRGHPVEIFLYFSVYVIYLIYGLVILIQSRQQILAIAKFGFSTGWPWFGNHKDDTNDELENFTQYITDNWYWYLLHIGLCTSGKMCGSLPGKRSIIFTIFGAIYLCVTMNFVSIIVFSILVITFYVISDCQSKRLIWLLAATWMAIIHVIKNMQYFYALEYIEYFTLIQLLSWTVLRGCSFSLQRVAVTTQSKANENVYNFYYYLGYILYFPCLIYGPFMGYHRYKVVEEQNQKECKNWKLLVWELIRVLLWWFFLQIASHYLYLNYMARDITALKVVDTVYGLHAIGYFMGQYFFVFYIVTYGLGIAFARYDGLLPTNKPRCIGRIHFYSDMWKYFDEGLYEFLFHHIYGELCSMQSTALQKLFATIITFAFVFVWHGCHSFVLIWSILNFTCLVAEKLFKHFITSKSYQNFVYNILKLKKNGVQRLNALLATQIYIPAAFSNVFFISGQDVGEYLMRGAYQNGWINYILLTFCSYCFFQCSQMLLQMKTSSSVHRITKIK